MKNTSLDMTKLQQLTTRKLQPVKESMSIDSLASNAAIGLRGQNIGQNIGQNTGQNTQTTGQISTKTKLKKENSLRDKLMKSLSNSHVPSASLKEKDRIKKLKEAYYKDLENSMLKTEDYLQNKVAVGIDNNFIDAALDSEYYRANGYQNEVISSNHGPNFDGQNSVGPNSVGQNSIEQDNGSQRMVKVTSLDLSPTSKTDKLTASIADLKTLYDMELQNRQFEDQYKSKSTTSLVKNIGERNFKGRLKNKFRKVKKEIDFSGQKRILGLSMGFLVTNFWYTIQ